MSDGYIWVGRIRSQILLEGHKSLSLSLGIWVGRIRPQILLEGHKSLPLSLSTHTHTHTHTHTYTHMHTHRLSDALLIHSLQLSWLKERIRTNRIYIRVVSFTWFTWSNKSDALSSWDRSIDAWVVSFTCMHWYC